MPRKISDLAGFALGRFTAQRQVTLPRWRDRASQEYAIAFPFKHSPHWLVIWPGDRWGLMGDEDFFRAFRPSNGEARKTAELIISRPPAAS